ncbi:lipase/esterase [Amycolatopsis mediterranei S699]|uniref:Lipase/esterase n=2 Tax=Amycolatopsis mediterranei TaxID=33910 RepID=A0A0H3D6K6_AMYMU|nr:alpha/beta hydrolase [Amycolatopsis mediterranei]ADJ46231.1 lipase/esterase [Amycolatopsis mediterranei U32]AEK43022.1 lipase/esterase [Amycolatopsis mediterranei S699]AFO77942.1 lipase/esterase [Amycolatopsis mediterranei S699]AGT85070.1 lipase/esterase [Amycolatopsis mediterranei RB]KDO05271.1 esterase [Amycolatopsis mediterranei]
MTYAIDPELLPWLDMLPAVTLTDHESLLAARSSMAQLREVLPAYEPANPVDIRDVDVPGPSDAPDVPVRVYAPANRTTAVPGLLYIHGGGFVLGDLDTFDTHVLRLVDELGIVIVSVGYRLAPEHPFPAPVEDCYAALTWAAAKADELGIDPARLGVAGESAGGGLSAAVALLARDRGGPQLCFQYLGIPELDDRLDTPSMRAYTDTPIWNRPNAVHSWTSYLGTEPGGPDVSPYAAPARAADLAGLPPAFVTTCQFDPLRDEGIAYAQRLAHAGVQAELRHYPGTFHGSGMVETAEISRRMFADELDALRRGLRITAG